MSDHEQIAQVAHDKWANEWFPQNILAKKSKILFFSMFYIGFFLFKKISNLLIPSFLVSYVSELLRSLTKNEGCEQIAQVSHQKWATMSNSLRSLTKNEQMSESLVFWANRSFAHFFAKNKRFAQRTD